jgi:hypothetical protein
MGSYLATTVPANWTLEFFIYFTSTGSNLAVAISNSPFALKITFSRTGTRFAVSVGNNGTSYNLLNGTQTTGGMAATTWHHFALVFNGTNYRIFVNGVLNNTVANTNNISATAFNAIKFGADGSTAFNGYIDEIRISNTNRYPSAFTPTTSAFTKDANTLMLQHFDGATMNESDEVNDVQLSFLRGQYGPNQVVYVYAMGHDTTPGYLATTLSHVEFNAVILSSMVPPGYLTTWMRQTPLAIPIQSNGTPFYVTCASNNFYLINPQPTIFTITSNTITTFTCPQIPVTAECVKVVLTYANNSASANPIYIGPAGNSAQYIKVFDTNIMFTFVQSIYVRVNNQQIDARLTTNGSTCIVQLEGWAISTDV